MVRETDPAHTGGGTKLKYFCNCLWPLMWRARRRASASTSAARGRLGKMWTHCWTGHRNKWQRAWKRPRSQDLSCHLCLGLYWWDLYSGIQGPWDMWKSLEWWKLTFRGGGSGEQQLDMVRSVGRDGMHHWPTSLWGDSVLQKVVAVRGNSWGWEESKIHSCLHQWEEVGIYRPISLTLVSEKVVHQIILERVLAYVKWW